MSDIALVEQHDLQLQSFLRFAKYKREQHSKEILAVVGDIESGHISDGVRMSQ